MYTRRQRTLLTAGFTIALLALIVAFVVLTDDDDGDSAASDGADVAELGEPTELPPIDDTTPDFLTTEFETFDGGSTSLAALMGTPTIVNFWASTCQACIAEMPDFEEVHNDVGDVVTFVGMNTSDRAEAAAELAETTGVTYMLGRDPDGWFFREIEGLAMPTTLFLGADGQLVDSHAGLLTADALRERIDEVFEL